MSKEILFPAIRCHIGDWTFYVTTMTFNEVNAFIKEPDEIHPRKRLSEWIQRVAIDKHSDEISEYIKNNKQRFLGAIIIGVYGGNPDWSPLSINFKNANSNVPNDQQEKVDGKLGLLHLTGNESLFAIDGQHRVAGIKLALSTNGNINELGEEEVSALFVGHDPDSVEGQQRTRRLFTTVNKKARRISPATIIALDEDNGFAITTRNLIDTHWLFEDDRKHISYTSTGSLPANDKTAITSVVGLSIIIKDLYPTGKKRKEFETRRPSDNELNEFLQTCIEYWDTLLANVEEYNEVFVKKEKPVSYYREGKNNHLLFRPIGQRAFTKAVQLLMSRGMTCKEAILTLLTANLYIESKEWHHILWNPATNVMVTNRVIFAETQLLRLANQKERSERNSKRLDEFLESIEDSTSEN